MPAHIRKPKPKKKPKRPKKRAPDPEAEFYGVVEFARDCQAADPLAPRNLEMPRQ